MILGYSNTKYMSSKDDYKGTISISKVHLNLHFNEDYLQLGWDETSSPESHLSVLCS